MSLKKSIAAKGSKEIGLHLVGEEGVRRRLTSDGRNSILLMGVLSGEE